MQKIIQKITKTPPPTPPKEGGFCPSGNWDATVATCTMQAPSFGGGWGR